jgi:hypothetical protein
MNESRAVFVVYTQLKSFFLNVYWRLRCRTWESSAPRLCSALAALTYSLLHALTIVLLLGRFVRRLCSWWLVRGEDKGVAYGDGPVAGRRAIGSRFTLPGYSRRLWRMACTTILPRSTKPTRDAQKSSEPCPHLLEQAEVGTFFEVPESRYAHAFAHLGSSPMANSPPTTRRGWLVLKWVPYQSTRQK